MSSPYVPSSVLVPITIFIDLSTVTHPVVLSDVESEGLDKDKLPDHIKAETAQWRRPNWSVATHITANSYVEDKEGRTRFDVTRLALARIRCLLVDWTLKDKDPALVLEKVKPPEMPGMEVLSDSGIRTVGTVDQMIVDAFYTRAMDALYPTAMTIAQRATEGDNKGN